MSPPKSHLFKHTFFLGSPFIRVDGFVSVVEDLPDLFNQGSRFGVAGPFALEFGDGGFVVIGEALERVVGVLGAL